MVVRRIDGLQLLPQDALKNLTLYPLCAPSPLPFLNKNGTAAHRPMERTVESELK